MNKIDRHIRKWDDPILKRVCTHVERGEYIADATELLELCCKKGSIKGVGIAAPQVGFSKRLIYINCRDDNGSIRGFFMLNPEVMNKSAKTNVAAEACLSYPGIEKRIRRHNQIEIVYDDINWIERRKTFSGYQARVIQHELDHLDGICLIGDKSFRGERENKLAANAMQLVAATWVVGAFPERSGMA
jgi:peptide deformylase